MFAAQQKPSPHPAAQENILVIKLGALGDFVQALGPMAAIRRHHPGADITLLTTKPYKDLAERSGYFNEILIDTRPKWHQLTEWIALRSKLNGGAFFRVYDLQNNDRTAFYLRLFSPRPQWVGAAPGASHRNTSPARTAGSGFSGHAQTLSLAGIDDVEVDTLAWLDTDTARFHLEEPYALIVAGSAPNRPEKRWPAGDYIAICKALLAENIRPALIGAEADRDMTAAIAAAAPGARDLTGMTQLYDLPPLARRAAITIGNDTGPMHMIAPTGAPTFVLFTGHSQSHRHAPIGAQVTCFQQGEKSVEQIAQAAIQKIKTR